MLNQNVEGGLGGAELPAPQAVLMKLVIDGVLDQNLPWALILIGVGIAAVASLFKIPVLAFAVGVYLPLSTMAAVFLGGLMRWLLTRNVPADVAEERRERGSVVRLGSRGWWRADRSTAGGLGRGPWRSGVSWAFRRKSRIMRQRRWPSSPSWQS